MSCSRCPCSISYDTYLDSQVSPESMTSLQGAGKMLNCYTLTMDIYIEKLPDHPVSLFQALGITCLLCYLAYWSQITNNDYFLADPSRPTEGECLVYEGGGVGVFGEVGVADASVRERRWSRVVVTLGTPSIRDDVPSSATAAALSRGLQLNALQSRPTPSISSARSEHPFGMSAPGSQDDDNSVDYDEEGSSLSSRHPLNIARVAGLRTGRINGSAGRSSSALATPNLPCLTTYVNSKKCSCVSASTRGVIGVKDGRFAINTQGFNLFSSSQIKYMPGLLVRFVELRPVSLSEARVKEVAFSNRIYSAWDKEQV